MPASEKSVKNREHFIKMAGQGFSHCCESHDEGLEQACQKPKWFFPI